MDFGTSSMGVACLLIMQPIHWTLLLHINVILLHFIWYRTTFTIVRGASQHVTIQNTQKGFCFTIRRIIIF